MYPGQVPYDYVKTGCSISCGYRSNYDDTMRSSDVIQQHGLRKIEFVRDNDIYTIVINIVNRVLAHKYSSYCLKDGKFAQLFDILKHKEEYPNRFSSQDGKIMNVIKSCCRTNFGTTLTFDPPILCIIAGCCDSSSK